jgi:hypothetical protein
MRLLSLAAPPDMRLSTLAAFAAGLALAVWLCHLDEAGRRRFEYTQASIVRSAKADRLLSLSP